MFEKDCDEVMKVVTVTGYKPMEMGIFSETDERIQFIKKAIEKKLIAKIEEGLEWVIVSGQMGVEMWTAQVALELKKTYDFGIGIVPPFENQEKRWPEQLQLTYQELTVMVDFFDHIYKGDYKGPFQFRAKDAWYLDKTDGSIVLIDEDNVGSVKYFLDAAKEQDHYPIELITPFDIDDVIMEMQMNDPSYWNE